MQSIISKGKNIQEAIQLGLELMETTKDKLNIEIIQQETKGIMGIGGKKAIVRLSKEEKQFSATYSNKQVDSREREPFETLEELVDSLPQESNKRSDTSDELNELNIVEKQLEGKVWVKDGKISVKESGTQYPLVEISKGVQLIKNNQIVKEKTTIVSEKDILEIKLEIEQKETSWSVSIDQHKLKVSLNVVPGYHLTQKIREMEPHSRIELIADDYREVVNTLSYEDVIKRLEDLRVTYGFNHSEIIKALETTVASTYVIASGKETKPGSDGWLELNIDVDPRDGLIEDESGNIDFREIKTIPTIEQGRIIATIHPPIPGQPGRTVTNEPLPAKQTHPIVVKATKSVMVVDDKVIATESGRPFVEQRGKLCKVSVVSKLIHDNNVDLTSGNIRFDGDVEVRGEIEDNMLVEAGGDIVVHKSVNQATLTASNSIITYGNVTGSTLSAGKNNMLIVELGHLLGIIDVQVNKMIMLIKQLTMAPAFKSSNFSNGGLQPLITILLEKKFNGLRKLVKSYVEGTKKEEAFLQDKGWIQVSDSLNQLFLTLSKEITSVEKIINLSEKMKELHEFSKTPAEPDSFITISSALNSSLYSSGNIIIIGKGSINTKIHTGGNLKISGIVRGGELYGRLGVDIYEVGSDSGTKTIISVPSDQKIIIGTVMEGTVIKIGHLVHLFEETVYDVNAHLNNKGQIAFD